jgi:flagellar hook-associated protein 2
MASTISSSTLDSALTGATPTVTSLGVGSGLDLSSLLDSLQDAEQARLKPLQNQESSYKTQISAYGQLQSALKSMQKATDALDQTSLYQGTKFSSNASAFSVQGSDQAVPGQYNVDVDQLAQAQSLVAQPVASNTDPIGAGGTITLSLGDDNGKTTKSVDIKLASGDSTLNGIRDAINNADIGINASIINDGSATPYRLVLTSAATGTDSQISISAQDTPDGGHALSDLLDYDSKARSGSLDQTVAARNAELQVNGIPITSQSNTVDGAIQGVTLSLSAVTSNPQSVSGTRDTGAVKSAISDFVKAYNNYHSIAAQLTAYSGADASKNGVLLGDSTARSVANRLSSALNTFLPGGDRYSSLAQIGVSLQKDGTMAIDDKTLSQALDNHLGDVAKLLTGGGDGQGVAGVFSTTLKQLDGDDGLVQAAVDGTQQNINNTQEQMQRMQSSIDAAVDQYRQQFQQLDSIMASLNSTQSYLTTQLKQLNNSGNNSNQ